MLLVNVAFYIHILSYLITWPYNDKLYYSYICMQLCGNAYHYIYVYDRGCTGTLDELVGSHTKLAIYPALAICCWRAVIHASLNTGFKGMPVVTYLTNVRTTKVMLTKKFPKRSGYMHMDKQSTQFILVILCSMRDTDIARVEGLWLINRPNCSVPEIQTTALRFMCALLLYFPPTVAWEITVMSFYDVTIICSDLLVGKPLCMHRGDAIVHLNICQHHCWNLQLP